MTTKNYVKEFKGFKVPDGATHFQEKNKDLYNGFYKKVYDSWFFFNCSNTIGWVLEASADDNLHGFSVELPELKNPQINWDEQPSKDAVWIEPAEQGLGHRGWHRKINGYYYLIADKSLGWSDKEEGFTVYHRDDCVVESDVKAEWLPEAGKRCVHIYGLGDTEYSLCDDNGLLKFNEDSMKVVCERVNSHDKLTAQVAELLSLAEELLFAVRDYAEYQHDGDPYTEDSRVMGEMVIDDMESSGRLEEIIITLERCREL